MLICIRHAYKVYLSSECCEIVSDKSAARTSGSGKSVTKRGLCIWQKRPVNEQKRPIDTHHSSGVRFEPDGGEFFHVLVAGMACDHPDAEIYFSVTPIADFRSLGLFCPMNRSLLPTE